MQIEFRMGRASSLAVTRKSLCSCLSLPTSYAPTFNELKILIVQASLVAQMVKNLPAMWKTWVRSLGWVDPEKGKENRTATHSSIVAWRIPWIVQSMGSQRVGHNRVTFTFSVSHITCMRIIEINYG